MRITTEQLVEDYKKDCNSDDFSTFLKWIINKDTGLYDMDLSDGLVIDSIWDTHLYGNIANVKG